MPKTKITKEDILKAAAEVVRKEGAEALNARRIAAELGCSTQPVYSQFRSMAELVAALRVKAEKEYRRRIEDYFSHCAPNDRYEAFGMGYVRFAREEKGLFRFLNSPRDGAPPRVEEPYFADILAEMQRIYGMDAERAAAFHDHMSMYAYGLAVQANTARNVTDEEIAERLHVEFCALYAYYFPERPPIPKRTHVLRDGKGRVQP